MQRRYPDQPLLAVGAVVFDRGRVLLVKRGQPPAAGQWSIPGGSVRLGETLQEAAEREMLEETGLLVRAGEPVHTFDVVQRDSWGRVLYHYVIVDLEAVYTGGVPEAGSDVLDCRWVGPGELGELEVNPETVLLLRKRYAINA
jgi:ADP-ribose pyrophosphatase